MDFSSNAETKVLQAQKVESGYVRISLKAVVADRTYIGRGPDDRFEPNAVDGLVLFSLVEQCVLCLPSCCAMLTPSEIKKVGDICLIRTKVSAFAELSKLK